MHTTDLAYRGADDQRFVGFLVTPDQANGAAVIVAHNAPGVSDFERGVARRLGAAGYVVLCADYIGDGVVLEAEQIGARLGPLVEDPARVRGAMQAALAALTAQPGVDAARVAAIGYCFGGAAALELARAGEAVAAVVGFHSSLPINRPEDCARIRAKVLVQQGAADPMVPHDMRREFEAQMNAAGVDWRMILFGGVMHGYTIPGSETLGMPGIAYDRAADHRSWRAMMDLFAESIDRA